MIRAADWPAGLDIQAALDMRGRLRPQPVRPPVTPKPMPSIDPGGSCAQELGILQRKCAQLQRMRKQWQAKAEKLQAKVNRRDERIVSITRESAEEIRLLEQRIAERDRMIGDLRRKLEAARSGQREQA